MLTLHIKHAKYFLNSLGYLK